MLQVTEAAISVLSREILNQGNPLRTTSPSRRSACRGPWRLTGQRSPRSSDETCEAVGKEFGLASKPPK